MKCLVCGKEFEGGFCPRCGYPVVEGTDVDALLESMRPEIEKYRQDFERSIRLGLIIFRWKESDGKVILDRKESVPFGSYTELVGHVTWLPQQFARIPDVPNIDLQVQVTIGNATKEFAVPVQNLLEPSLQNVGIEVTGDMMYRVKLKNETGNVTDSQWMEIK